MFTTIQHFFDKHLVKGVVRSLNVLLTNPIWVLVIRMETQNQAERKILEGKKGALMKEESENGWENCILRDKLVELESVKLHPYGTMQAHEIYNETGITGFWKGIIPTLIMVCNPSIQFMIYETSFKHLKAKRAAKKDGSKDVTAIEVKKP